MFQCVSTFHSLEPKHCGPVNCNEYFSWVLSVTGIRWGRMEGMELVDRWSPPPLPLWRERWCLQGRGGDSRCWHGLKGAVLLLPVPSGVSLTLAFTARLAGGCGSRSRNTLGKAVETYGLFLEALIDFCVVLFLCFFFNPILIKLILGFF